ncbi:hypothetical protein CYMTET_15523 [Cymbomonas tetramitiformis]|uniref:Uncharacterized protein n=1 Tax=Cymbomonas tetramitiformis TaxID=36881 RepID=A0AAE0GFB6_9CHLO|nr:hypothetical protein CYMTET_15523 [Cymbomonas tetramitiformis]
MKELCGFSSDMATSTTVLENVGKIVPIYDGITRNGIGAIDGSFFNPTALRLTEFQRSGVIDPKLLALLQSKELYVSDALQNDMMPTKERGGIDMLSSSNSWTLVNNIAVPNENDDVTFDVNFCYVGAVVTKQDATGDYDENDEITDRSDSTMRTEYIESTASVCSYFASLSLGVLFTGTVQDSTAPHGCILMLSTGNVIFNIDTTIMAAQSMLDETVPIAVACLIPGSAYRHEHGIPGLTCAQSTLRRALSMETCVSQFQMAGEVKTVDDTALPYGCVSMKDTNAVVFNTRPSTTPCSESRVCICEKKRRRSTSGMKFE